MNLLPCLPLLLAAATAISNQGPRRASRLEEAQSLAAEGAKLLQLNEVEAARTKLEAALKLDPGSANAHYLLGVAFEGQQDFAAAIAAFRDALRYAPKMAEAHDRLEVRWPGGTEERWLDVPTDRFLTLKEWSGSPLDSKNRRIP